jgi:predicted nucleotidyltransferase
MTISNILRVRLEPEADILFALLFGSAASGEQRPNSDLDVGVYVDERLAARERFDLRLSVAASLEDLGQPDVIVLNDAPPLLAHRALQGKPRLARIEEVLTRLRELAGVPRERYLRDAGLQAQAERWLQL